MHNLLKCILRMEDYIELMPIILYYLNIQWADLGRLKQAALEIEDAISTLKDVANEDESKSGIISYYLHELKNSQQRVKECINIVQ